MIRRVRLNKEFVGYIVNDYYIPRESLGLILSTERVGTTLVDMRVSSIRINTEQTRVVFDNLSVSYCYYATGNHLGLIRVLILNSLHLNDLVFLPITYSEIRSKSRSGLWGAIGGLGLPGSRFYKAVDSKNYEVVAYLYTLSPLEGARVVYLNLLETAQPRTGQGTRVINQLCKLGYDIQGLSSRDAVPFWIKVGGMVTDSLHFKIEKRGARW